MAKGDVTGLESVRFVVLDTETTGLDPRRDRIITMGAIGFRNGEILLDDVFEALLRVEHNTSAVTVHGVTRDDSRHGIEETSALASFLEYLGDGVIVGHHIGHDVSTLNAGYERMGRDPLPNRCLDTMDLALHLERDGAFAGRAPIRDFSLDALCGAFGVVPHDRHTASGDAFLTGLVFQRLVRLAAGHGRTSLDRLAEPWVVEGVTES
jgi:DNA polymerase-3 subunit epsilon